MSDAHLTLLPVLEAYGRLSRSFMIIIFICYLVITNNNSNDNNNNNNNNNSNIAVTS